MTIEDCQEGTSSTQFLDWIAYVELERLERHREDFNFGLVVQAIYTLAAQLGRWVEDEPKEVPFDKCMVELKNELDELKLVKKKKKRKLTLKSKVVQQHIQAQKLIIFGAIGLNPKVLERGNGNRTNTGARNPPGKNDAGRR